MTSALARIYVVGGTTVRSTGSVGIALGEIGATAESLLHDADRAMYRAKRHRRPLRAVDGDAAAHGDAERGS